MVVRLQWLHFPWQQPIWIPISVIMVCQPRKCRLSLIRWLATNWPWTIAKLSSNSNVNAIWIMVLVRYQNVKAKVRTLYLIYKSVIWCTLWGKVTKPRPVRSNWSLTCGQIICILLGKSLSPSFGPGLTRSRCVSYTLPVVPTTLLPSSWGHCAGFWQSSAGASAFILCACPGPAFPFAQGWTRTHHAPWTSIAPSDLVIPLLPPSPGAYDEPPPTCKPADLLTPPVPLETESHHNSKEETLPTTRVLGTANHLSGRQMANGWWTNHYSTTWFLFTTELSR